MIFQTDKYQIEIFDDVTFAPDASDNINDYDLIHFDKSEYSYPSVYGIKVYDNNGLLKSAVIGSIGGGTSIHSSSVVVDNDRIVICCADSVFCLSIPEFRATLALPG